MISDSEILSFIEDKIIVKNANGDIVYSNIENPLIFEKNLICQGPFIISSNFYYVVNNIKMKATDNNDYEITVYKKCKVNDYLTGVMTRGIFEDTIRSVLRDYSEFIIIIGDIDNFKMINDSYGHRAGDEALKMVGNVLKENIRNEDIVGRYGGEEFIICLLENDITRAYKIVENIRKKVQNTIIDIGQNKFSVTMTFGISSCSINKKYEDAIEEADIALYTGKENGRNQTIIYKSKQKSMKVNPL